MITEDPADRVLTKPELVPIVATAVLLLVHVPPLAASDKVVVKPRHRDVVPVIGPSGLTVTVCVAVHPVVGRA